MKKLKPKDILTKEFLIEEYVNKEKGGIQIAKEVGCHDCTVYKKMKEYDIPIRDRWIDISGKRFGHLVGLYPTVRCDTNNSKEKWVMLCDCGKEKEVKKGHLLYQGVISCGCKNSGGKNHHSFTGHEGIYGSFWRRIKFNAEKRNIRFDLSIEDAWDIWNKQNGICVYTGIKLILPRGEYKNSVDIPKNSASLDRINSKDHYHKNNIQWIHKNVNQMKWATNEKDFLNLCYMITDYTRSNQN